MDPSMPTGSDNRVPSLSGGSDDSTPVQNDDWLAAARVKLYNALKVTDALQYHVVTLFKHIVEDSDAIKLYMFYTMEAIEAFFRLQEVEFACGMGGVGFRSMRINRKSSISMTGPPMFVKSQ
eukprot:jgi/Tetstr1/462136/TSEL_007203.t1